MLDIVRKAADRIGGVPKLAGRIGVSRQAIYQWREIPLDRVAALAQATGVARADLRPDVFAGVDDLEAWQGDAADDVAPGRDFSHLRRDRLVWMQAQVAALEAGTNSDIDTDQLVGLLRSLAQDAHRDIERRLSVILVRLLKWQYRPLNRSLSTIGVIHAERARVLARFADSPSLKVHASAVLKQLYADAAIRVADETGLAPDVLPADCPFSLEDLLDPGFAPTANVA